MKRHEFLLGDLGPLIPKPGDLAGLKLSKSPQESPDKQGKVVLNRAVNCRPIENLTKIASRFAARRMA